MTDNNKFSKVRKYKYGINAFILTISIIGIVFILNAVLIRYSKQYDLTKNKSFSLSSQTIKVLENLKKEVAIYIFSKDGDSKNEMLNDILKQYERMSEYIKVINIDLDKNPSLSNKFNVTSLGTIVFACGDSNLQINQTNLYAFGSGMAGHGETSKFNGEQVITNNIMKITTENRKSVYFLIGHGERRVNDMEEAGMSKMYNYLIKDNYDVKTINISKNPDISVKDAVLIIPGPKYFILEKEISAIEKYLEKGGKVFVMIDPQVAASDGIARILAKWGIKMIDDIVIEHELSYFGDILTPIPKYIPHAITNELLRVNISAILPGVRTITKDDKKSDELDIRPFLHTSGESWSERDYKNSGAIFDEKDIKGPLTLAISVEKNKKIIEGSDTTQSENTETAEKPLEGKLVAIGDSDFVSNRMAISRGNIDLFLNTVNWLAGDVEKISIRPIVLDFKKMDLNKKQSKIILLVSLAFVPLFVAGIGGVIWWKRRSL